MKRGLVTGIVVIVVIAVLAVYFYSGNNSANCGKIGEQVSSIYEEYPEKCCEGLTSWASGMDTSVSIGSKCYETSLLAGSPVDTCINCGNGVCEETENACNCVQDCKNGENSKYDTIQTFCEEDYNNFCRADNPQTQDLPLCQLCE
ncbi:hypothetical protein HYW76_01745 [Candidatus Pacearchaeota archaeon]|nr:hypothetical protein [Candidatus Pacearchaeota archaeon]